MPRAIKQIKTQRGFTLIEIMVVLVILGALAVISVPVYSNYVRRAKISEAISNVEAFANAIRIFKMEKGSWPTKANLTTGNNKVVDVNETYFKIDWTSAVAGDLTMTIDAITTGTGPHFDIAGNFTYNMTQEYKGTWANLTGTLLTDYAPYLLK